MIDSSVGSKEDDMIFGLHCTTLGSKNVISESLNNRNAVFFFDMIKDFNFLVAIPATWADIEHVSLVPISVVDLIESILPGVEKCSSVHDIIEEGINFDVGG